MTYTSSQVHPFQEKDMSEWDNNDYADFWYCERGVNVFPADGKNKKPFSYKNGKEIFKILWAEDGYETNSIPESTFKEWKEKGFFEYGMALVCGKIFRGKDKGKWLNVIDCDNRLAIDEVSIKNLDEVSTTTIVEQHANKDKAHIYLLTEDKPLKLRTAGFTKESREKNKVPSLEVKSEGKQIIYCTPSIHKDGSKLQFLGIREIKTVSNDIDKKITIILNKFSTTKKQTQTGGDFDPFTIPLVEVIEDDFIISEGENRNIILLRLVDSWKIRNPEFTYDTLLKMLKGYNNEHCDPPYPLKKIKTITKDGYEFGWKRTIERIIKSKEKTNKKEKTGESLKDKLGPQYWYNVEEIYDPIKKRIQLDEFVEMFMSDHHFATMTDSGQMFYYDNGMYVEEGEIIIKKICEASIPDCRKDMVKEIIEKVKRRTYHKREEFDNFKDGYLNFKNCRLHIETMQKKDYTYEDLILTKLPVNYDKTKKCPNIMKFLKECLPNSYDRHSKLEHIASTLLPDLKLEKAYMDLGGGANGKSTFFYMLQCFLGSHNYSSISIHDMLHDKFKKPELFGVIANIYSEISKKEIKELEIFKLIVSGDSITADKKNLHPFKFNPIAKHFFSANRLPQIDEDTDAVFRRFEITMWNQQFVQEEKGISETVSRADLNLKYKITTPDELSGLLNIILIVMRQLSKRGKLLYSKTIKEMRKTWKSESDTVTKYCDHFDVEDGWVMLRTDYMRYYRELCLKMLHEAPEPEADVIKKTERTMPVCVFIRERYNGSKNKMQVVKNIKFKDSLGMRVGYDSGMKAKKTASSSETLFSSSSNLEDSAA